METFMNLLAGLVLASILLLILIVVIGAAILICGIVLLVRRKKRIAELEKTSHPAFFGGVIADMRCTPEYLKAGIPQYNYAYAIHYSAEDGQTHRAFLGVRTLTGMTLQVGSPVQLAVFPVPLIQPSPQALDPLRGADGMLPPQVELCTWMDRPIDETGTVMLYDDYQTALDNANRKNRTAQIVGWLLIGIVILRVLLVLGSVITEFAKIR